MITDKEREILEYKPKIGFIPKIFSTVEHLGNYVMPPALLQLTSILPSDILSNINDILDDIDSVLGDIESKIEDNNNSDIPFEEYKKEKTSERPDFEKICKFEDFHEKDINGSTEGEVYPLLTDLKDEMKDYRDFINNQFFNGTANYEHLDVAKENEVEEIDNAIYKDIDNNLSDNEYEKLEAKSILTQYAATRLENTQNFIQDIKSLLSTDLNKYYNSNMEEAIETFGNMPTEVLDSMNAINKIQFNKKVKESLQDKRRLNRFNTKEMKEDMNNIVLKISKLKLNECNKLLNYIKNIDTNYDSSPNTIIVENALDNIEFIQSEYNKILKELYKYNHLDAMVKTDHVNTLLNKKNDRDNYKLINNISSDKKNNNFRKDNYVGD